MTRSESVIQDIINAERYFWECVEKDIPPDADADASRSAAKALQQLYPEHVPLILGRISIGKIVEKNGKRLPEKDDQFTLTSQIQNKEGWVKHPQ